MACALVTLACYGIALGGGATSIAHALVVAWFVVCAVLILALGFRLLAIVVILATRPGRR